MFAAKTAADLKITDVTLALFKVMRELKMHKPFDVLFLSIWQALISGHGQPGLSLNLHVPDLIVKDGLSSQRNGLTILEFSYQMCGAGKEEEDGGKSTSSWSLYSSLILLWRLLWKSASAWWNKRWCMMWIGLDFYFMTRGRSHTWGQVFFGS